MRADAAAAVAEAPAAEAPARYVSPSTVQTLKEWAGYIPEVRLARAIYRWAKKQPPSDGLRLEERESPQAR